MARSRRFLSRHVLWSLLGGFAVTVAFSQLVFLANSVADLRREIDDLQKERDCLVASVAHKTAEWNQVSAREVVVSRAEKELGLITPDGPGTVIVMSTRAKERTVPTIWRVLGTVGGGGEKVQAVSAQPR
jgi:cell division protein FtsB